ncbi:SDR family oxidoreductase [Bacillus sp. FJAT-42376]|uniref:SDR family NAD(P)-dependent oxidoreductase n=1 Tax=Bacillus sp. FJAT-42376 TaxID=2014076 RepID=UPI000F4F3C4F|nr:SDR family oxidoreductase [Bacillus sp. FJAT-42376]AZB42150.1 SDR family oxidoreductase [Bacillus sp. FJAT-42376]
MNSNEYVLITGASGGIGMELAKIAAEKGYALILAARNEKKLLELKENLEKQYRTAVMVHQADLSKPEEISKMAEELKQKQIHVSYLVNNAGFGLYGEFLETNLEDELNMIDLNIRSLTHMAKLFLPEMAERKEGGILNIASTAAFQPGPLMAVYYATKAYVLSFTEALENELKGTNIKVSALCPGPTATGFSERADLGKSKLFNSGVMRADQVAQIGFNEWMNGKTVIVPGFQNKLLAGSVRFMPRKMVTSVVRRVQGKNA